PLERLRDNGGMNALRQQSLRSSQKTTCDNNNGGCAITRLNILGRTHINQHSRRRVHDAHISHHGVSVVGLWCESVSCRAACMEVSYDDRVSFRCLNLCTLASIMEYRD